MDVNAARKSRAVSPLWCRALERYQEELEDKDDLKYITETVSLQDLLRSTEAMKPLLPPERGALAAMHRLGPTLKFVDDFSAVLALCFGADAKLTGFVWGSIRLMLHQAASAADVLKNVLEMLEELSLTLPRFSAYEEDLRVDRSLETAIVDVYTEVICFYARCIHFFRTHPHVLLRRAAWEDFRVDFTRTLRRIRRLSSTVETAVEVARMKHERVKYSEVLQIMDGLKAAKLQEHEIPHHHYLPSDFSSRFYGRQDALNSIEKAFASASKLHTFRSFALHGMGGVGKTQIALQYAIRNREKYHAIFWIAADNLISMGQSFRNIAQMLGFVRNDQELQDTTTSTLKVKNWLNDTDSSWLLIFDNADDLEILRHVWPSMGRGCALITTRDASAAQSPASAGFHVQPFNDTLGSEMLLDIVGLDASSSAHQSNARAITNTLGGLPLALNQIGGFIAQRKLPLQDFLPLYERNATKIDARKTGIGDYDHTLSTLMPYLHPDAIDEGILLQGSSIVDEITFAFLHDELDLGDAEESLLKLGLLEKDAETGIISIHRLIQTAVMRKQADVDRAKYFHVVVQLLSRGFPDTWSQDIGHQIGAWRKCEKCLPHVHHMVEQRAKYGIRLENAQEYGELLLRCSWYVYEREVYGIAKTTVEAATQTFEDKSTLAYASAVDLGGLVDLDRNYHERALVSFNKALEIRQARLGPQDPLIASSLNNIALAYTEMGRLDEAYATHEKAIRIRLDNNSDRIGNSYSNMSSLLLRMGKPDEAEEMLKRCPSLKNFTDETFLGTGNPRFSGDMVLLSRIRLQQGRLDDAMRLASKALAFRQRLLGNGLKVCDSLYDVAYLMHRQGNSASAIELLQQLVDIASSIPEGKGQLARAYYWLATLNKERGRNEESELYKSQAEEVRSELRPDLSNDSFEEESFAKLCLWMLW